MYTGLFPLDFAGLLTDFWWGPARVPYSLGRTMLRPLSRKEMPRTEKKLTNAMEIWRSNGTCHAMERGSSCEKESLTANAVQCR